MTNMSDEPVVDNIEQAMDAVAENIDMTVATKAPTDDDQDGVNADKQILIRATRGEHERWKRAAEITNTSMSSMVRNLVNNYVQGVIDCPHPMEYRKSYPWAEFCMKCDTRLRG
jgi:hypothetical protein